MVATMTCLAVAACGAYAPLTPSPAPSNAGLQHRIGGTELIGSTAQGVERVCTYRQRLGTGTSDYRVGLGQPCPSKFPVADRGLAAPPSAPLERSEASIAGRSCTYRQGAGLWTITLPITQSCPLNVGMAQQAREAAEAAESESANAP